MSISYLPGIVLIAADTVVNHTKIPMSQKEQVLLALPRWPESVEGRLCGCGGETSREARSEAVLPNMLSTSEMWCGPRQVVGGRRVGDRAGEM